MNSRSKKTIIPISITKEKKTPSSSIIIQSIVKKRTHTHTVRSFDHFPRPLYIYCASKNNKITARSYNQPRTWNRYTCARAFCLSSLHIICLLQPDKSQVYCQDSAVYSFRHKGRFHYRPGPTYMYI